MSADLNTLTGIRSWLVDSLLAYLQWVVRQESEPPHYFPARLRGRTTVLDTIWRRLQVRSRPERSALLPDTRDPAVSTDEPGYEPRRRPEAEVDRNVTVDEETAMRYRRAVITGEPGAGKTWLLHRIACQTAQQALDKLDVARTATVDEILWPIRVRLPELARSSGVPIVTLLAAEVCKGAVQGLQMRTSAAGVSPRLGAFVVQAISAGDVLVLLDAWDEVPTAERPDLRQRLRALAESQPQARLIVTTRDGGGIEPGVLRPSAGLGEPPADLELLALEPPQVDGFITAWFNGFPPPREPGAALRAVLHRHPPMRELARSPLMLTFMTRLAEAADDIQTRRGELYDRVLRGLLSAWPGEDEKVNDVSVAIPAGSELDAHLRLLSHMALALIDAGRLNEVRESDLCALVERHCTTLFSESQPLRTSSAEALLRRWKATGVLVPLGGGLVAYLHRTFQEYLAGVALVPSALTNLESTTALRARAATQCSDAVAKRLAGNDYQRAVWEEPIRLALGYIGLIEGRADECGTVVRAVIERAPGPPGRAAAAMGLAVSEISSSPRERPAGVPIRDGVTDVFRAAVVETVRAHMRGEAVGATGIRRPGWWRLLPLIRRWTPTTPAVERAACGDALARLGDPRFHGAERWHLPDYVACAFAGSAPGDVLGFVLVDPPQDGTFQMGSAYGDEDARADEKPLHPVRLSEPFYLARWPVTVAQFGQFVKATLHDAGPDWERGLANHPVATVSLRDALAYCDWLDEQLRIRTNRERLPAALRDALAAGWRVSLPSEAQWEWAARGADRHVYPVGRSLTADRANFKETGIGTTSAVGCFPGGASWRGIEELAGNVWEWTRSKYEAYPWSYSDADEQRRNALDGSKPRVLRGGSFNYDRADARAPSRRNGAPAGRAFNRHGFRLVLSPFCSWPPRRLE